MTTLFFQIGSPHIPQVHPTRQGLHLSSDRETRPPRTIPQRMILLQLTLVVTANNNIIHHLRTSEERLKSKPSHRWMTATHSFPMVLVDTSKQTLTLLDEPDQLATAISSVPYQCAWCSEQNLRLACSCASETGVLSGGVRGVQNGDNPARSAAFPWIPLFRGGSMNYCGASEPESHRVTPVQRGLWRSKSSFTVMLSVDLDQYVSGAADSDRDWGIDTAKARLWLDGNEGDAGNP